MVRAGTALRIRIQLLLLAALLGTGSAITLCAQLVADGATNTLANVTNNVAGDVTVGTNGSSTVLELSNNALLINSLKGLIGRNATARFNEVRLTSPTARWQLGTTLTVGSNGAFNRLVISNGAQVIGTFPGNTAIMGETAASTNNFALVTGTGSMWSNAGVLNIGYFGARNQLVVSNGARVHSADNAFVGLAASSTNNRVTVNGAGSLWSSDGGINLGLNGRGNGLEVRAGGGVRDDSGFIGSGSGGSSLGDLSGPGTYWTNTSEFHVGSDSAGNQLLVNNGAVVFAGTLGLIGRASGASLNAVTISDPGSMWMNGGELYVGRDGAMNQLFLNNSALVTASNLFIGVQPSSTNNRVVVNNSTLRATNAAGTGVLDVRRGTNQLVSGLIEADRLVLTNAAGRFEFLSGTLITRGAFLTNGSGMNIGPAGGGSAVWNVRPGPTHHFVSLGVAVGNASPSNQLLITGGARLTNNVGGFIGLGGGANGNAATVSGPGSRWQVLGGQVSAGAGGTFNRLTVSDGGRVDSATGNLAASGGGDNLALVTGAGSVWSNAAALNVGADGPNNQLQVSGGGLVISGSGSVGLNAPADANIATVADLGSEWRVASTLDIGTSGSFNRLFVSDGGRVSDNLSVIGNAAGANDNAAIISGLGSLWSHANVVAIGESGARNQLVVSNGATVTAALGRVGGSSVDNEVVVTGTGSMWSNATSLIVGESGNFNRLSVQSGGRLFSGTGALGYTAASNQVSVTGSGSVWSNQFDLTVGAFGTRNQLFVGEGASVFAGGDARIGNKAGGNSNAVVITDPGARWLVNTNLSVGEEGSFNQLVISNGGFARGLISQLGNKATASNNMVLVTGAGSVWSNALLAIGDAGSGNQLVVSNAGAVFAQGGVLGDETSSVNNLALVTGPGSAWQVAGGLFIGFFGGASRLQVENAGQVITDFGIIGEASDDNEVLVTGAGSIWSNRSRVIVGSGGSANRLTLSQGGSVSGSNVIVGAGTFSANNQVAVNGGTLRATATNGIGFLDVCRGTTTLVSGLVEADQLLLTNNPINITSGIFGNNVSNNIPSSGPAAAYPSIINVSEMSGAVTNVTVTLSNLSHTFPADLDILLVGPAGHKVMLMSDAGDVFDLINLTLKFDDAAGGLPYSSAISSGTYHPTDYEGDSFPSPAPAGPYSTNLATINGSNPNGAWSLYVVDDGGGDGGSIIGWSLQITTDPTTAASPSLFEHRGGTLITRGAVISNGLPFIVGGPGGVPAIWEARGGAGNNFIARDLLVGSNSSGNQLLIPSGTVVANSNVIVGASPSIASNNLLHVTGGTLRALTPGSALDIRGGTNRLDAGLVDVARLVVTNARGQFEFNGGTLRTPDTVISNGRVFTVGGGPSTATLQLLGGTHTFANNLTVATNGLLIGSGTVDGTVTVAPGGRLIPGAPIGSMNVLGTVILQGTVNLQIDKSGGVRTSDEVIADGAIFYNGTLNVTHIGTDELSAGDRFFLFDATPYIGSFTTLTLPPLAPGLSWRNNLSLDGSLEVISQSQPGFARVTRTGTNMIFTGTNGTPGANYTVLTATNVALPTSNWVSLFTGQFGAGGNFSFTNTIAPNSPRRFFQLRTP